MAPAPTPGDRGFRWAWTWRTAVGFVLGFLVTFATASASTGWLGIGPWQSVLAYTWLGAGVGLGAGLGQSRLLARAGHARARWAASAAAGMGLAGGAGYGAAVLIFGYDVGLEDLDDAAGVAGWTIVAAAGGALTGLLQRRVAGPHLDRRWVASSAAAWALAFASNGAVDALGVQLAGRLTAPWVFLGALVLGGLALGAASGGLLRRGARDAGRPGERSGPHRGGWRPPRGGPTRRQSTVTSGTSGGTTK